MTVNSKFQTRSIIQSFINCATICSLLVATIHVAQQQQQQQDDELQSNASSNQSQNIQPYNQVQYNTFYNFQTYIVSATRSINRHNHSSYYDDDDDYDDLDYNDNSNIASTDSADSYNSYDSLDVAADNYNQAYGKGTIQKTSNFLGRLTDTVALIGKKSWKGAEKLGRVGVDAAQGAVGSAIGAGSQLKKAGAETKQDWRRAKAQSQPQPPQPQQPQMIQAYYPPPQQQPQQQYRRDVPMYRLDTDDQYNQIDNINTDDIATIDSVDSNDSIDAMAIPADQYRQNAYGTGIIDGISNFLGKVTDTAAYGGKKMWKGVEKVGTIGVDATQGAVGSMIGAGGQLKAAAKETRQDWRNAAQRQPQQQVQSIPAYYPPPQQSRPQTIAAYYPPSPQQQARTVAAYYPTSPQQAAYTTTTTTSTTPQGRTISTTSYRLDVDDDDDDKNDESDNSFNLSQQRLSSTNPDNDLNASTDAAESFDAHGSKRMALRHAFMKLKHGLNLVSPQQRHVEQQQMFQEQQQLHARRNGYGTQQMHYGGGQQFQQPYMMEQ
jgi:hypothetical protein